MLTSEYGLEKEGEEENWGLHLKIHPRDIRKNKWWFEILLNQHGVFHWAKPHTVLFISQLLLKIKIIKYSNFLLAFLLACCNIQRGNYHDSHQEKHEFE